MHTLDILIPHYQDPSGLKLSLASVESQDWLGTKRVIVVDDGSQPKALAEVRKILENSSCDSILIEHPENMGRPAARNTALRAVTAPYMAWLDAGDTWSPTKIGRQMRLLRTMEDNGEDVSNVWVSCHYDWRENDKTRLVRQSLKPNMFDELIAGSSFRAYLWTLLGRTEAFRAAGLFDEDLPRLQDLDYFLRFVQAGGRFAIPDRAEALCCYYKSDAGRNHKDVAASARHIFEKHRMTIEKSGLGPRVRWKNAMLASRFARNNGSRLYAFKYLGSALFYNPRYAVYRVLKAFRK